MKQISYMAALCYLPLPNNRHTVCVRVCVCMRVSVHACACLITLFLLQSTLNERKDVKESSSYQYFSYYYHYYYRAGTHRMIKLNSTHSFVSHQEHTHTHRVCGTWLSNRSPPAAPCPWHTLTLAEAGPASCTTTVGEVMSSVQCTHSLQASQSTLPKHSGCSHLLHCTVPCRTGVWGWE